ncbi:MAG TPA: AAA family ATPase [Herpetosiphonaceae bacterium]
MSDAANQSRTCPNCGFGENGADARFCGQCSAPLPLACPGCGAVNPPGFRFCGQCATALPAPAPPPSTRRVVTVLFADICNYTALTAQLGGERMYLVLDGCLRRLSESVRRFGGTIDKFTGDGLMAVFGMPTALEQHAVQAAYAALAMADELAAYNEQISQTEQVRLAMRLGLASGEVVAGQLGSDRFGAATVIGDVVNIAARLQQVTEPDTILLNQLTAQTIEPVFELAPQRTVSLKGYAEPLAAQELLGKRAQPESLRGIGGQRTPLAGRQRELELLENVTLQLESGLGAAVCVLGEAGIGKSRITNELINRIRDRDLQVFEGDCAAHTRMVPYSAFIGVVRDFCRILPTDNRAVVRAKVNAAVEESQVAKADEVVPYLEYLLSIDLVDETLLERVRHLDPAQLKRQVFQALRTVLFSLAQRQPVMLILDDLHWADELSVELITYLADSLDNVPLLLYLIARNDGQPKVRALIDALSGRLLQRFNLLELPPLATPDLQQMAVSLLPTASSALIELLVEQAEGVPFYLEELVRHALERHIDLQAQEAGELSLDSLPLSLEALLRARVDHLPAQLQQSLAQAAVIGRRFSTRLLRELDQGDGLAGRLAALQERGFIRPRRASGDQWTFNHILTHETVYGGLLAQQRRDLHTKVAWALEDLAGDRIDEHVDALAYHYSRSHDLPRAMRFGLLAAERSASRYANDEALRLYDEVAALLQAHRDGYGREHVQLHAGQADVLMLIGRYDEARAGYEAALQVIAGATAFDETLHASVERRLAATYEKQGRYDEARHHLERARLALGDGELIEHARIDADAGWIAFFSGDLLEAERLLQAALITAALERNRSIQALAYNRLAGVSWRQGDLEVARGLVEQSLEMSRQLNDQLAIARALNNLGIIADNQGRLGAAEGFYTESMETYIKNGDLDGQIRTSLNAAHVMLQRGRLDAALQSVQMTFALARQVGDKLHMALSRMHQGKISFFAGDLARARRSLIEAECLYRSTQSHQGKRADVADYLGRIALIQDRRGLALALASKGCRLAEQGNDAIAAFHARRLLALVHCYLGQLPAAETELERLGTEQGSISDPYEQGLLQLVRAECHRRAGRFAEAFQAQSEANRLFDQVEVPTLLQRII